MPSWSCFCRCDKTPSPTEERVYLAYSSILHEEGKTRNWSSSSCEQSRTEAMHVCMHLVLSSVSQFLSFQTKPPGDDATHSGLGLPTPINPINPSGKYLQANPIKTSTDELPVTLQWVKLSIKTNHHKRSFKTGTWGHQAITRSSPLPQPLNMTIFCLSE